MLKLNCTTKLIAGSAGCTKIRASGNVPCIVYGANKENKMLIANANELKVLLEKAGSNDIEINIDNKDTMVVKIKSMQTHPVNSKVVHIDFIRS